MAIVETKHTMAAIEKIKNELSTFMKLVRVVSMAFFSIYYAYLIYSNITSAPHLIAYVILFALVVTTFIVEVALKANEFDTRKSKREKIEKRRKIGIVTKTLKYLAKGVTVGFALYAALVNPTSDWDLILDIVSCGILVISVLAEVVTSFVNRYIDYLKLGFGLDYEDSSITNLVKIFGGKQAKVDATETELHDIQKESRYTLQEEKIRDMLKKEAERLKDERNARLERRLETNQWKITKLKGKKLSKKQKESLTNKYATLIDDATKLMDEPKKLSKQLAVAEGLVAKLPQDDVAKFVQNFLALADSYSDERYTDILREAVISAIAVVLYFVSSVDETSNGTPSAGQVDTAFLIDLWLKQNKKEWKKFIAWQKNNDDQNKK